MAFMEAPCGDGEFTVYVKYNAKAGRWYTKDDAPNAAEFEVVNMTAVFDIPNLKTGWFLFQAGSAPDKSINAQLSAWGPKPSDAHKRGFQINIFSDKNLLGVREFASTAGSVIGTNTGTKPCASSRKPLRAAAMISSSSCAFIGSAFRGRSMCRVEAEQVVESVHAQSFHHRGAACLQTQRAAALGDAAPGSQQELHARAVESLNARQLQRQHGIASGQGGQQRFALGRGLCDGQLARENQGRGHVGFRRRAG